jgi:hypothetical protein
MRRTSITAMGVLAAIALSGLSASPASAVPPLACYKAVHDEFGVTGNYEDAACTKKTAVLKSEYVLAEPLVFLKEDLWCAKLNPVVGPPGTGLYENGTCTKRKENGEFTEVIIPTSKSTVLPEFAPATAATMTGGEGSFTMESTKIACKASTGKLGAGNRSGTFAIDITGCKSIGEECKGLAQSAGLIEETGEWHLVSQKANRKAYDILLLFASEDGSSAIHIECASPVGTLYLLWGSLLGSIEASPSTSERTFKINIETEGSGATLKQRISEFGNNSGEAVKAGMKGKLDEGSTVSI